VNAKIKAMRGNSLSLEDNVARLLHYIHERPLKNFIKSMADGLIIGKTDIQYYLSLWQNLGVLDKLSQKAMRRVIGMEIDLRNILWIYRLKRYYGVVGDATFGYLIPVGNKIPREMISRMAAYKDIAGLIAEVAQGPYDGVFGDFNHGEQKLAAAVQKQYQREIRKNPNSIATVCGYLYEKSLKK